MKRKKNFLAALAYGAALTLFTAYFLMDTFVIERGCIRWAHIMHP